MLSFFNKTFKHGIHPPDYKSDTKDLPIRQLEFAPVMILPLSQSIGNQPKLLVKEGDEVVRGQLIATPDGYMSVALHAPISGKIRKIGKVPSITGKMVDGIYIESAPWSTQQIQGDQGTNLESSSADEILNAIQNAGIVGLGGAAFPTHVKLKIPDGKQCDVLIINGIECEPFLTTDHRVMLEQANDIFTGIQYLMKATGAPRTIIGIEANKQDAADHLKTFIRSNKNIEVKVVPVKYPQGAEKMLITSLLNREVPSGGLPIECNAVVVNVATTAEIGRLLPTGKGIQERVITVTGPAVKEKGNYLVPIGTPLRYLLESVGVETDKISELYMGGPMMGTAISNLDISITKGTSGIVAFTNEDVVRNEKVYPCIRCGACVDACPISLNPSKLGVLAKYEAYDEMAKKYNLLDCFECGSCSYVCPSHIPLVQYFRMSKRIVRKRKSVT
ncbi:MAG: electron transport complex subunit RsxC [bacterium]|nr:electron transport complex subunit RsxC [bacterium]